MFGVYCPNCADDVSQDTFAYSQAKASTVHLFKRDDDDTSQAEYLLPDVLIFVAIALVIALLVYGVRWVLKLHNGTQNAKDGNIFSGGLNFFSLSILSLVLLKLVLAFDLFGRRQIHASNLSDDDSLASSSSQTLQLPSAPEPRCMSVQIVEDKDVVTSSQKTNANLAQSTHRSSSLSDEPYVYFPDEAAHETNAGIPNSDNVDCCEVNAPRSTPPLHPQTSSSPSLKGSSASVSLPPFPPPSSWSPPRILRHSYIYPRRNPTDAARLPSRSPSHSKTRSKMSISARGRVPRRSRDGGLRLAGGPPDEEINPYMDMDYVMNSDSFESSRSSDSVDAADGTQGHTGQDSGSVETAPPRYRSGSGSQRLQRRGQPRTRTVSSSLQDDTDGDETMTEAGMSDADTQSLRTLPPEYQRYSVFDVFVPSSQAVPQSNDL